MKNLKKLLAVSVVVAMIISIAIPLVAFADPGDQLDCEECCVCAPCAEGTVIGERACDDEDCETRDEEYICNNCVVEPYECDGCVDIRGRCNTKHQEKCGGYTDDPGDKDKNHHGQCRNHPQGPKDGFCYWEDGVDCSNNRCIIIGKSCPGHTRNIKCEKTVSEVDYCPGDCTDIIGVCVCLPCECVCECDDDDNTGGTLPGGDDEEEDDDNTGGTLPGGDDDEEDDDNTGGTLPGGDDEEDDDDTTTGGTLPGDDDDEDDTATDDGVVPPAGGDVPPAGAAVPPPAGGAAVPPAGEEEEEVEGDAGTFTVTDEDPPLGGTLPGDGGAGDNNSNGGTTDFIIQDNDVPLAFFENNSPTWSLVNLILAAAGIALAVMMGIRAIVKDRNEDDEEEQGEKRRNRKILAFAIPVLAILGTILFILTQNMSLTMGMVDSWTLAQAALFAAGLLSYVFVSKKVKAEDEQEANGVA